MAIENAGEVSRYHLPDFVPRREKPANRWKGLVKEVELVVIFESSYCSKSDVYSARKETDMIDTVIFDLGGVLIDWNPRYVYRTIFRTEEAVEYFLEHVCSSDWNEEQDGGRGIAEATEMLKGKFPAFEAEIEAFYGRWTEMLGGPISGSVEVLRKLKEDKKYRLLALTNWSAETWPEAVARYEFLQWFEGIVVSGQEHLKKPDPAIYRLLIDRYDLIPERCLFIDDNLRNVRAAELIGIKGFHYVGGPLHVASLLS